MPQVITSCEKRSPKSKKRQKVLVVYNPAAGSANVSYYRSILRALGGLGVFVIERRTEKRGDALRFAKEASVLDYGAIVVAGGDGTINEAINGIHSDSPPLGIAPLGSANVLAAEIKVNYNPFHIANTIAYSEPSKIFLGLVNGRRFAMMAGIGIDAHVVKNVSPKLKVILGRGAYVWQAVREISRLSRTTYSVTIDSHIYSVGSAVFANGHFYGGRFISAPKASLEKNTLHACLLLNSGQKHMFRYAFALAQNKLVNLIDVNDITFNTASIDGPVGDPIHADGDIVGYLPAKISCDPLPLNILRPFYK